MEKFEKTIITALDNLSIDQAERLLEKGENMSIKINRRDRKSIENAVHGKIGETKQRRPFSPKKIVAIAFAATFFALTVTAGAASGWDYPSLFGSIFGGSGHTEIRQLTHTIKPEVRESANMITGEKNSGRYEVDVLGIAGDNRALYMVFEVSVDGKAIDDYNFILQAYDFTSNATGKSLSQELNTGEPERNFFINFSAQHRIISKSKTSTVYAVGFEFIDLVLENGYMHFMLYARVNQGDPAPDMHFFDVLIDYDFSAVKTFEVNQISNIPPSPQNDVKDSVPVMLKTVEVTPIAVRIVTEGALYDHEDSVKIKFKNGDVLSSVSNSINASGFTYALEQDEHGNTTKWGDGTLNIHFDTPYDLNDVYSVTVGDVELKF